MLVNGWNKFQGWLSAEEANTLYGLVKAIGKSGIIVIEVGSWKGRSTAAIGAAVDELDGILYCVDHWLGTTGSPEVNEARGTDIFNQFKKNMYDVGLWSRVKPMVMSSGEAARIIADGVADMVFLDADHRYREAKNDIEIWLPKVKRNGIICGHDCEGRIGDPGIDHIISMASDDDDCLVDREINVGCHPGVIRAVTEAFRDTHTISHNIWWRSID